MFNWLAKLVHNVLAVPYQVGWILEKKLNQALKINTFQQQEGEIIRSAGLFVEERIPLADITEWWIVPEMGFDMVFIKTRDGKLTQWFDNYNDLLAIFNQFAHDRKKTCPRENEDNANVSPVS